MNDIQDIILESEYNVLNSLYEYYNKQYIMESYYMEDGEQQPSTNPQSNPDNTNGVDQQSTTITMETIEQNIQQVQTVINNVEQEITQMDSIASQAQDAVNPEQQNKRKAAEAKVKAGSSLLQKLGELFGTIANTVAPVARMEGEPLPDPKYYGQKVIDSIKKATTVKDVQTIYNNAEKFYTSAYKWYNDRAESPSQMDASLREGNYCKNKCKIIQQWRNDIKQVQEQRINELNQQSNQIPGTNPTT